MLIFRESLQGYRPFEVLCEGLSLGETVDEALRRARVLLGLRAEQETKFATLIRWGNEAGILEASDGRVTLATEVHPQSRVTPTIPSASDLNSAMKVRLYNSALLGQSCNQFIDEIDRALLADALMKVNTNPRGSAGASGQALEDFLREVATERGLSAEAKKCSGAGQLAGMLCSKSVIHSHHQKLVESSSTVRNATSHKKDKASLAPWEITSEGALSALLGAMTAMRSIYEYVYDGRQRI